MENETMSIVLSEVTKTFTSIPGFTTMIRIFQTAGILFIAYLIFLFIKGIFQYKKFSKIKDIKETLENIDKNLESINKKLTGTAKTKSKK